MRYNEYGSTTIIKNDEKSTDQSSSSVSEDNENNAFESGNIDKNCRYHCRGKENPAECFASPYMSANNKNQRGILTTVMSIDDGSKTTSMRSLAKRTINLSFPGMQSSTSKSLFIFSEENVIRKYAKIIIEWGYPFINYFNHDLQIN